MLPGITGPRRPLPGPLQRNAPAYGGFQPELDQNLPAGDGGLFVTDSAELNARARIKGLDSDPRWNPLRPLDGESDSPATTTGWMYLPRELTTALGRAQLHRLPATTARSHRKAARLTVRLAELAGV